MDVDRAAAHDRYDRALGRAGAFLRGMQRRDGSTAGARSVWGYYSQPLALLSGGSPEDWSCANRCLDFVRREHVTAAGTVGVEPLPYVGDLYVYPYLIRGAATWGRTDLSVPLARSLARFQDPCGGIRYRIEAPGLIDPATTAHGGIALLATSHLQHAQRAGRFLLRLHRMQRDPADRYLTVWDTRCDAPVSDYDSGADMPWGSGSALRRDNPEGGNAYWDIGYIIAFLTALSRATGSPEYLGAARELFDLFDGYAGFADHDRSQAQAAVDACRYPPLGSRGMGPRRAAGYGRIETEYLRSANDRTVVAIQIETGRAVERIDEILSVPGIDAALLGLGDLSASLGCHLDFTAPRVVEAVETVLAACRRHRVLPGMAYAHDAATARAYVEQGFRLVGVGSDDAFLMDGSRRALDGLESLS